MSKEKTSFVYVTYIRSTPEKVFEAITKPEIARAYWGHENVSDWQPGSAWQHVRTDGSGIADVVGTVLESVSPERLVMTFADPKVERDDAPTKVAFTIEPHGEIVRLTVIHENIANEADYEAVSAGWPAVLANLKSLLETGHVLPQAPWEMHSDLRAARMALNDPR